MKEFRQPDAQQSVGTVRVAGILPAIRGRDALDTKSIVGHNNPGCPKICTDATRMTTRKGLSLKGEQAYNAGECVGPIPKCR